MKYEVDAAMMGSEWDHPDSPDDLERFCEILQEEAGESIRIVAITDSWNGAGGEDGDLPDWAWERALERYFEGKPCTPGRPDCNL